RSPTAEVVLRHYCDEQQLNIVVDSAGTSNYHPGKAPDLRSQQHALKRGYDLSTLRARQLTTHDFIDYDLILAMDLENLSNIQNRPCPILIMAKRMVLNGCSISVSPAVRHGLKFSNRM